LQHSCTGSFKTETEKLRIPGTSSLQKNSGIPGSFKSATKKSTVQYSRNASNPKQKKLWHSGEKWPLS
jgi:hypothetical protein